MASNYGSADEIKRKVREGVFRTERKAQAAVKNPMWDFFESIVFTDSRPTTSSDEHEQDTVVIPYVSCIRCKAVLTYDSKKGGTSHLRRHAENCKLPSTSSTPIDAYFKASTTHISKVVKEELTMRCAEFVCKDMRPFEIMAGKGFANLAHTFINIEVKYGQVSGAELQELLPHPTTVSRKVGELYDKVKEAIVPELAAIFSETGGGVTTDMWTEPFFLIQAT
jgi:hypothetical protein